jgi:signal transduction histidine kinase
MLGWRNYSISKKLLITGVVGTGSALVLACAGFIAYEWFSFPQALAVSVASEAEIVGTNSASALLFHDPAAAQQTLGALAAEGQVVAAAIYDRGGHRFAAYQRDPRRPSLLPPVVGQETQRRNWYEAGQVMVMQPIVFEGEQVGVVGIQADLQRRRMRAARYAGIAVVVLMCSLLMSSAIFSRLRRMISDPIHHLAQTAALVSREKNYSVRASGSAGDELGILIQTFNEMLEQIQLRDNELQAGRSELERRVADRTAQLTAINGELEAFTYSVSHDLRAPLRHISGFVQILEEDHGRQLPEDARRLLARISQGARNMGTLVDELLQFSRLGRQPLSRQLCKLDALLGESLSEVQRETADRDIEWRVSSLPLADCDPVLVKQIFVNLLSNAVKFTRTRQPAIIEVGQQIADGSTVIFVRDNGVGFSMKYADKLFRVFQRLHRNEDFEGTGVGLAMVDRIVKKHGGRIWTESELDRGAAFYFTLDDTVITQPPIPAEWTTAREMHESQAG